MFSRFTVALRVPVLRFFAWLNDIPVYGYSTFCLSIHQMIDVWGVPTCRLL